MNHLLLYLLFRQIGQRLARARIEAIHELSPLAVLTLRPPAAPAAYLVVIRSDPGPFCFLTDSDPLHAQGMPALRRVHGARVAAPVAAPVDRIVRLPLADGAEGHFLTIVLYGSAAKLRVEGGGTIIESLDSRESGQPAPVGRPPSDPHLAEVSASDLTTLDDNALRRVRGWSESMRSAFSTGGRVDVRSLIAFRDALVASSQPFFLGGARRQGAVAPLPESAEAVSPAGPFADAAEACESIGNMMVERAQEQIRERYAAPILKHLSGRRKLKTKLEGELATAEGYDVGRAEADVLAAYQTKVPANASYVELPDLYHPGRTLRIELDPAMSLQEQIRRRYKRAAKLERSRETLRGRIDAVENDIRRITEALDGARSLPAFADAIEALRAAAATFGLAQQPRRRAPTRAAERSYRRFDLNAQWFVLVGRNDRENDEITFKLAQPGDIWMHAQHVAGSHVVLKSTGAHGNPPQAILLAAAGIAAYYSKARHATLVPVIYTERKYVRKFRGARPGEVRCEREKTIFAEARLPE